MYALLHSSGVEDFSHNLQSGSSSGFFLTQELHISSTIEKKGVNRDSLKGRGRYYEGGVASGDG